MYKYDNFVHSPRTHMIENLKYFPFIPSSMFIQYYSYQVFRSKFIIKEYLPSIVLGYCICTMNYKLILRPVNMPLWGYISKKVLCSVQGGCPQVSFNVKFMKICSLIKKFSRQKWLHYPQNSVKKKFAFEDFAHSFTHA